MIDSGPFAEWQTVAFTFPPGQAPVSETTGPLRRSLGHDGLEMPSEETIRQVMMYSGWTYDSLPWNGHARQTFRGALEFYLHDAVHDWIGGHMAIPEISPNDPVFYLHHANVDRLWYRWQNAHPGATYSSDPHLPQGQKADDKLLFLGGKTPADVWDPASLPYHYERGVDPHVVVSQAAAKIFIEQSSPIAHTDELQPPGDAEDAVVGLQSADLTYLDTDHHVKEDEFVVSEAVTVADPTPISFSADLTDKDDDKPFAAGGRAGVLFISGSKP